MIPICHTLAVDNTIASNNSTFHIVSRILILMPWYIFPYMVASSLWKTRKWCHEQQKKEKRSSEWFFQIESMSDQHTEKVIIKIEKHPYLSYFFCEQQTICGSTISVFFIKKIVMHTVKSREEYRCESKHFIHHSKTTIPEITFNIDEKIMRMKMWKNSILLFKMKRGCIFFVRNSQNTSIQWASTYVWTTAQ